MGAAADISPRLKKSQPASVHRVRLEKLRADGLEYANAERRAGLIAANEVSAQLATIGAALGRVIESSKLQFSEKAELAEDLLQLTAPRTVSASPPQRKAKRRRRIV